MRNQRRSGIGMTVLDATGIADQARIRQTNQPLQNHFFFSLSLSRYIPMNTLLKSGRQ
jgi:hypothetical protein